MDGNRLMSIDAALLVLLLLLLLLLLLSDSVVVLMSPLSVFSSDAGAFLMCGIPLYRPCCGAASGTMRLRKPLVQPHGKILQ